jgi:O-antigen ligase
LLTGIAGLGFSLLLTVTRASWLASLISSAIIVLLGASRRAILIIGALAIPLVLAGIFLLQQKRHVRFFDQSDESTTWRETVWREGFDLLVSKPRHLLVGVGMDSLKAHWREWGLFDRGRLPQGHMHSNLLQLALERGLPALIVWLLLLGVYARLLWRLARRGLPVESRPLGIRFTGAAGDSASGDWPSGDWPSGDWIDRGIALGALGGLAGFFSSGLVHYNWGDSEVVMTFYFIMGLSLFLEREARLKL